MVDLIQLRLQFRQKNTVSDANKVLLELVATQVLHEFGKRTSHYQHNFPSTFQLNVLLHSVEAMPKSFAFLR